MAAFRVPDDLADKDLRLSDVKQILDNRKAIKRAQARLAGLPKRKAVYESEIATLEAREGHLLSFAEKKA